MIAVVKAFGDDLSWHPHVLPLVTRGVWDRYDFFATAGSTIDVTLERVDTSKPWEHPDGLDS